LARVGILGGTFNPPHAGHVALARAAADALGLDGVLWMPVAQQPLKAIAGDPGAEVRLELTRLATREDPRFQASDLEIRRGGPSYAVDTLRALHEAHPEDELTFIAGADAAQGLPGWRDPAEVLALARLAVAGREGASGEDVRSAIRSVSGAEDRVEFFDMTPVPVSSTRVRAAAAAGESLDGLVPPAVAEAIAERGLYREAVSA
jgi:nicotinate-nucleotide adenylyltransferase